MNKLLSKGEQKVYDLLVKGYSNDRIARQLALAQKTIKFHLTNIFKKLKVKSRAEVIVKHYRDRDDQVTMQEGKLFKELFK